jgi:hypothetical protein
MEKLITDFNQGGVIDKFILICDLCMGSVWGLFIHTTEYTGSET